MLKALIGILLAELKRFLARLFRKQKVRTDAGEKMDGARDVRDDRLANNSGVRDDFVERFRNSGGG